MPGKWRMIPFSPGTRGYTKTGCNGTARYMKSRTIVVVWIAAATLIALRDMSASRDINAFVVRHAIATVISLPLKFILYTSWDNDLFQIKSLSLSL
jgi:hypothetical protein